MTPKFKIGHVLVLIEQKQEPYSYYMIRVDDIKNDDLFRNVYKYTVVHDRIDPDHVGESSYDSFPYIEDRYRVLPNYNTIWLQLNG